MHTKEILQSQLKNLDLVSTDTVMLHCSLRAIGAVKDGANGIINAFCEYLSDGLFVVPAFTWDTVNAKNPIFDVNSEVTPSLGILPQVFAKCDGVKRSLHPTHSLCAFGRSAKEFVSGEENVDVPCARNGCYGKLLDLNAQIILAGVTFERCTFLHATEDWQGVPNYLTSHHQPLKIKTHDGTIINRPMRRHASSSSDNYDRLLPHLKSANVLTEGKLGNADCLVVSTKDLNRVASKVLSDNISFFK